MNRQKHETFAAQPKCLLIVQRYLPYLDYPHFTSPYKVEGRS